MGTVLSLFIIFLIASMFGAMAYSKNHTRMDYISSYQLPEKVLVTLQEKYPHLSETEISTVIEGFKQYCYVYLREHKELTAMPSKVVDTLWHEFIIHTKNYETFCLNSFGRFLHHSPFSKLMEPEKISDAYKRTWYYACEYENLDPRKPTQLPLLFAIDTILIIPDGNIMSLKQADSLDPGTQPDTGHVFLLYNGMITSIDESFDFGCGGCGG